MNLELVELDVGSLVGLQSMFAGMLEKCPDPTKAEIAKLMSLQGYYWQKMAILEATRASGALEIATSSLASAKGKTRLEGAYMASMKLSASFSKESRECMRLAAEMLS